MNGTIAAESFIFLSGFIVAVFTFRRLAASKAANAFTLRGYYARRFWRQVPVLLFVIALTVIWPLMGSGPIWTETIGHLSQKCRLNWTPTAFFYVNFVDLRDMVS